MGASARPSPTTGTSSLERARAARLWRMVQGGYRGKDARQCLRCLALMPPTAFDAESRACFFCAAVIAPRWGRSS